MAKSKNIKQKANFNKLPDKTLNHLKKFYILIFIVSVLAYINTLTHGYVLDDYSVIKENYVVKKGFDGISTILKTGYRFGYWNSPDNLYRPFPLIMFAIEWQFFPDTPLVGHLINIILYGILCVLLFMLFAKLLNSYPLHIPFIAVLLFSLHPIHTEVVANIKSRDEILAFLFGTLTILSLLKHIEKNRTAYIVYACIAFLFALLSKESAITLLAIIPLTFYFFTKISIRRKIFYTVILIIPTFIFFVMRHKAIGQQAHLSETTMIDNLLVAAPNLITKYSTAIKILGLYLWKLIIPYPLACDYSYNQIPITGLSNVYFIISLLVYMSMFIYAIIKFKTKDLVSYAILFYLISMSIYSNLFITIGTSFGERLLFVPSFAYTLVLSYFISKVPKTINFQNHDAQFNFYKIIKSKPFIISVVIMIPYFYLTVNRNKDWKTSLTLYEADIKKSPNSAHMNYYYGLEVMKEKAMKDGQVVRPQFLDTAIYYFYKAKQIIPTYADAYDQLGLAYFRKNEWDKSLAYYDTCLRLAPTKSITYSNMGVIYFNRQQYDKALEVYEKAVRYDPRFADAWFNLGSTYGTLGKYNEAINAFKKCIEINPDKAEAYYYIGITYQMLNDNQNAQFYLNKAYELKPSLKK